MRENRITKELQKHDRLLFCDKSRSGRMDIFRKGWRYESYLLEDKAVLKRSVFHPHYVFSLTHNWNLNGRPVDWGLEPIVARVKAMDLWNRNIVEDMIAGYAEDEKCQERTRNNSIESFLYDFRSQFKKTFSDVNTSNLKKTDKRRTHGYR